MAHGAMPPLAALFQVVFDQKVGYGETKQNVLSAFTYITSAIRLLGNEACPTPISAASNINAYPPVYIAWNPTLSTSSRASVMWESVLLHRKKQIASTATPGSAL